MKKTYKILPVLVATSSLATVTPLIASCGTSNNVVMVDLLHTDYKRSLDALPALVNSKGETISLTREEVSLAYYSSVMANKQILLDDLYSSINSRKDKLLATYSKFECNFSNPTLFYDTEKDMLRVGFNALYNVALKDDNVTYSYNLVYNNMPLEFNIETVRPIESNIDLRFKLGFTEYPLYDSKWSLTGKETSKDYNRDINLAATTAYETKDEDYVLQSSILNFNINNNYMINQVPSERDKVSIIRCKTLIDNVETKESVLPKQDIEQLLYGNGKKVIFQVNNLINKFAAGTYNMSVTARLVDSQDGLVPVANESSGLRLCYLNNDKSGYIDAADNVHTFTLKPIALSEAKNEISFDFFEIENTNDEVVWPILGIREPVSSNASIKPYTWAKVELTLDMTNEQTNESYKFDSVALLRLLGTTPKI